MAKSYRYEVEDVVRSTTHHGYECDECYGIIRGIGEVITDSDNITLYVCRPCAADIRHQNNRVMEVI